MLRLLIWITLGDCFPGDCTALDWTGGTWTPSAFDAGWTRGGRGGGLDAGEGDSDGNTKAAPTAHPPSACRARASEPL